MMSVNLPVKHAACINFGDFYYNKLWKEYQDLYNTTGAGPYFFNHKRTRPWIDGSYYMQMEEWLKTEFNLIEVNKEYFEFAKAGDMTLFLLRFS